MLIDLHVNPGDLSPEALAKAVADAGLDAVVVTPTDRVDRLDAYLDALEDVGVAAFGGVELLLDYGALVFVPRELDNAFYQATWSPATARTWRLDEALAAAARLPGVLLCEHPYQRGARDPLGDRVYDIRGLVGLETRIGHGTASRDHLADAAADTLGLARLGSSSGDSARLGAAVTIVSGEVEEQHQLCDALEPNRCHPLELDDPAAPRDRRTPVLDRPPPRRDGDRDGRGPRGDRPGRERGPRGEGGEGKGRGPRRDAKDRPRRDS